jgi:signal transduction histidine kinase/CheY-like chemotaxis protein
MADDRISTFSGGGAAGEAMRATDWSKTSIGPAAEWPKALLAHVRAMLRTRQPTCIFWGRDLVNLYNDGFLPILGEKHPSAMGQRAEQCWSEAWSIVGPQLTRVLGGESIFHEEVLVPIARGGLLEDAWWNYSYSPLFDDAGDVGGVLVVCTEMTNEVVVRRRLEAVSRSKDEFLATVSHELRTPLTAILGWARLLADETDLARLNRGITIIERNAVAQGKIIEDILDMARIISGKLQLSLTSVDLASMIHSVVDSVRPAAVAKELALDVQIDVEDRLTADEDRLQQVVWNLLSNAVKFTPKGGRVAVRATRSGDDVRFEVTDSGRGISPEFLPYVFDRFRQDDATTTKQHAGLGLGLAIVRHLVELHGGTVKALSEGDGRGATFEVVLPLRAAARTAVEENVARDPSAHTALARSATALEGVRVLVVDDQQDARELVATVLADAGAEVVQAFSAATALDVLSSTDIAAIVSDIGMPTQDGYALLQRIRTMPRTRNIPALALTAFARLEDRHRALASGFQDHVAKPIDPGRLVDAVTALVRR